MISFKILAACGILMLGACTPLRTPITVKNALPNSQYLQNETRIVPAHSGAADSTLPYPLVKWGYKDLQGNWLISPQYGKANWFNKDGIAEVILKKAKNNTHSALSAVPIIGVLIKPTQTSGTISLIGLIDLNGNILASYKSSISEKRKDKKYKQAFEIVSERRANGLYDNVFTRFARIDADIYAQQQREQIQRQREQAQKDSILMAQELLKRQADSSATAKRIADSISLAKEREIIARISSGKGLSLSKVKVTGHGMLLSKDETWQEYTIRMDDFNRIRVTYEGTVKLQGELDVLKTIYESDWNLLSDNLFQSIEISKMTLEVSQGAYTKKFSSFSFLITVDINDFNSIYTDEESNLIVSYAISQVERFISSFINHYQNSAYFVEPLFQVKVGGREGITIGIIDKQGNGASLEDAKRICNESLRSIRKGNSLNTINRE